MESFWKRLGEHALFTFITLFITMVILIMAMGIWDSFRSVDFYHAENDDYEWLSAEEVAKELEIRNLQLQPNSDNFVVTGTLVNPGNATWNNVGMDIEYFVENISMGSCSNYSSAIAEVLPKQEYFFTLSCPNLSARKLPTEFSFKVRFNQSQRTKEKNDGYLQNTDTRE